MGFGWWAYRSLTRDVAPETEAQRRARSARAHREREESKAVFIGEIRSQTALGDAKVWRSVDRDAWAVRLGRFWGRTLVIGVCYYLGALVAVYLCLLGVSSSVKAATAWTGERPAPWPFLVVGLVLLFGSPFLVTRWLLKRRHGRLTQQINDGFIEQGWDVHAILIRQQARSDAIKRAKDDADRKRNRPTQDQLFPPSGPG